MKPGTRNGSWSRRDQECAPLQQASARINETHYSKKGLATFQWQGDLGLSKAVYPDALSLLMKKGRRSCSNAFSRLVCSRSCY